MSKLFNVVDNSSKEDTKMSKDLVFIQNDQVLTDSRVVAEKFKDGRHDHVLRDIEAIIEKVEQTPILGSGVSTPTMFFKSSYRAEEGGRNYPMYLMNRDGFTLLVMGFTGKEAMEWKLKYIAAFNAMEEELKKQHEQPKQKEQPITALGKAIHDLPDVVNVIQSMFKVHDGIAMAQAIDLTSNFSGLDISSLKQLIPSAKHKTGFMNATQVGEKLGVKARVVNRTLAKFGYIEKIDDDWRLTEKGFDYGEEMPYTTNNGHSGYQIRWNEDIVTILDDIIDEEE